ncbi:MAG: Rne/Rng family ribonuclease [Weeksellaceae bacterium]|jgi:ribonuclease G|nr:Rne/Rng family ribonuclease [Weeksellaceae bacterium]MDX9704861.1 Rne/Rng family ribonuclease [Weeksellaceae bacterium]
MDKELLVSSGEDSVQIALLEEGRLMELHKEHLDLNFAVGDMYLGKVKKLAPSLNAAFVDIGYSKDAFLHYHDLGPNVRSSLVYTQLVGKGKFKTPGLKSFQKEEAIKKDGTIDTVLSPGDQILIQITKEPIHTKGPRITSEISIAGRYLILVPFSDKVSVSQKIKSKSEKDRLTTLIESIKPEGFGIIIRTVAEEKKVAELHADLNYLMNKWQTLFKNIQKKKIPIKLLNEMDRASAILRDNFSEEFVKITVDDEELANDMKEYLNIIAPGKSKIVKTVIPGEVPLFEQAGIERQIKFAFGKNVTIPQSKGAYLVIEHTEALHVVDVNSGNISRTSANQEDSALTVNKIAATEIARQLRLRDMGGIIVVDFIDMTVNAHKIELYDHLKSEMQKDKAKHKILPPSKFGLIQITRQRVRPELSIVTKEENPNPQGERVEAPIVLINRMEQILKTILETKGKKIQDISLHVHPFVAAYLTKGLPSIRQKWYLKYKKWVKIVSRDSYKYLQFNFLNKNNTLYNESN